MDVAKAPALDPGVERAAVAPQQGPPSASLSAPAAPLVPADRVDIGPLDANGALQILLAEVRAALPAALEPARPALSGLVATISPADAIQAPLELIDLFLRAVPESTSADPTTGPQPAAGERGETAWAATVAQLENDLSQALDKGVSAVAAWRDVPQAVVGVINDARSTVLSLLAVDRPDAAWLRPEWLGLAPRIERYRRRRRLARRGLSNPDHEANQEPGDEHPGRGR